MLTLTPDNVRLHAPIFPITEIHQPSFVCCPVPKGILLIQQPWIVRPIARMEDMTICQKEPALALVLGHTMVTSTIRVLLTVQATISLMTQLISVEQAVPIHTSLILIQINVY